MGSVRRVVFRISIVLFVLLAAAGVAGALYLQKLLREMTPRLEVALTEALGAPVKIGRSSLGIRHGLGIAVFDVQVARAGECVEPLRIREVSLRADIEELLHRRVVIDELLVDGLRVQLEMGSAGQLQLVSEKNGSCAPTPAPAASSAEPAATSAPLDVNLQFNAIAIHDLDAEIRLPTATLTLNDLEGGSGLHLGTDKIDLSDLSIKCALQNKSLNLTASNISIGRKDKSMSYNDLSVQLGSSRARGLGSIQYVETAQSPIQGSSELTEVQAEFEELGVMLKSLGISGMPAGLKGTLSGKLKISLTDAKAVQGDVSVSNFAYGKDLKAGLLSLSNVSLQLSGSSLQKVSANSAAKNLFIRNGTDEYSAGSLQGDLLFIAGSAWRFSSNKMSFGGFGYSDQETTLREVNADLKTISVGANARGDIDATAQLSGYALKLQHLEAKGSTNPPDLEIKQIGSAEVPLRLKLPSSGGYELSGTMAMKDGALVWQKRDFQKINGSIRAIISGPLKKFEAIPLQFLAAKEPGSLRGAFEMTAAEFKLSDTTLSAFGGVTTVGVSLGREGRRELRSTTSIRNVDAGRAIPLVSPQDAGAFVGTLKQAALVFNARWGDFKRSATGSGSVEVLQGDVKKFDLTRVLGNALSAIPGVSISKGSSARGDGPESPAQSSRAEFQIQPNLVIINSMELQRDSYSVRGSGTADFEGHISATARVTFLKENLGMLGSGLQAVTSLLGGLGRIDIPILISGKIPEISINVDMSTFLREKSGLTTAESVIGTTGDILGGIGRAVLSPFGGSGNSKKSKSP